MVVVSSPWLCVHHSQFLYVDRPQMVGGVRTEEHAFYTFDQSPPPLKRKLFCWNTFATSCFLLILQPQIPLHVPVLPFHLLLWGNGMLSPMASCSDFLIQPFRPAILWLSFSNRPHQPFLALFLAGQFSWSHRARDVFGQTTTSLCLWLYSSSFCWPSIHCRYDVRWRQQCTCLLGICSPPPTRSHAFLSQLYTHRWPSSQLSPSGRSGLSRVWSRFPWIWTHSSRRSSRKAKSAKRWIIVVIQLSPQ